MRRSRNMWLMLVGAGLVAMALSGPLLIAWDRPAPADAIVVVGGDHKPERVWWAVDLYNRGYAPVLILSGGTVVFEGDEWITEAEMMRRYARIWGVPDEAVILEERSSSTIENAQFCQEICSSHGYHSILLVTSPYHSRRARRTFREVFGSSTRVLVQPALQGFFKVFWWRYPDHVLVVLYEYQHRLRDLWMAIVGFLGV
ncbi:MAG: YdcF family protein [Anaerolineae bacterium]|nr:YdcF family protein [Anaerolineae bacterium]